MLSLGYRSSTPVGKIVALSSHKLGMRPVKSKIICSYLLRLLKISESVSNETAASSEVALQRSARNAENVCASRSHSGNDVRFAERPLPQTVCSPVAGLQEDLAR